jgi:hypothetical protein
MSVYFVVRLRGFQAIITLMFDANAASVAIIAETQLALLVSNSI